jgi:acyl carrier protein phosphodiesterase
LPVFLGYRRSDVNHLAHCYLSDGSDLELVGGLMGDFVKGRLESLDYPRPVLNALRLHRHIDSTTDAHARVRTSRDRFDPEFRRYAGILTDVFYDHFLARHWARYHETPLADFARRVYDALDIHEELLPERLKLFAVYMRQRNLLLNYRELDTIDQSLKGIASRLSRANPVGSARTQLEKHYDGLESDFHAFFPDVVRMAKPQQGKNHESGSETF